MNISPGNQTMADFRERENDDFHHFFPSYKFLNILSCALIPVLVWCNAFVSLALSCFVPALGRLGGNASVGLMTFIQTSRYYYCF